MGLYNRPDKLEKIDFNNENDAEEVRDQLAEEYGLQNGKGFYTKGLFDKQVRVESCGSTLHYDPDLIDRSSVHQAVADRYEELHSRADNMEKTLAELGNETLEE